MVGLDELAEPTWRVVPLETRDAATNMAIDEAVAEAVGSRESQPTIRFYQWQPSAVSIGYFQSLEEEVDLGACKRYDINFVRRRTGGGAVYHDLAGEITYSVIAPESMFPKDIIASYRVICGWLIDGLAPLGIRAEFKPINDITVGGKKISGNAQTRRGGVLLQHGTLLYDVDVRKMFSLLKVPDEKIRDKMIAAVEERVTSVLAQKPNAKKPEVADAMLKAFTKGKRWSTGSWTKAEMARADELAETRYSAREWNFLR